MQFCRGCAHEPSRVRLHQQRVRGIFARLYLGDELERARHRAPVTRSARNPLPTRPSNAGERCAMRYGFLRV